MVTGMRAIRTFGALVLLGGMAGQAAAQDWIDQGGIKSREYKKEIRGDSGVEATEFFTLEYSVAIQITDEGRQGPVLHCQHTCQGKKHKNHAACDFSCDTKCPEKDHKATIKGEYRPDLAGMRAATAAANGLAIKGGGAVSPNDWSHRVSSALAEFRNECKKKKTFDMPHAAKPCSGQWWWVGTMSKSFKVRGTMKRVGYRMSRGMRTPIDEVVGTHEQVVATGQVVVEEPFEKNAFEACLCFEPPTVPPDYSNMFIGPNGAAIDPRTRENLEWRFTNGGVTCYDTMGKLLFDARIEVEVVGNDMNTAKLVLRNGTGQTVRVVLPPGTMFLPADPLFQIMCALAQAEATIPSGTSQTLYVNIGPPPPLQGEAALRWACMEMNKKEPTPSVKYRIKNGSNDGIANLAAITARSRFRGPHDQARIWMFTDRASREEINKRMIPGVSAGVYAILLHDLASRAGVDFTDKAWLPLVQPNLMEGLNLDDRTIFWFVDLLAETKDKDLAAFLNGKTDLLAAFPGKDGADGAAYLAWIATASLQSSSPDLQRAAAKLLRAVPMANREAVAKAGGLEGVRWLLVGGQEASCSLAFDVLEAYGAEGKEIAMAALEALPTEALKARAAKLAGVETAGTR